MPTAERARARAEEAERLARMVSYERDRVRLLRQAQEWRERAEELDALEAQGGPAPQPEPPPGLADRLRALWPFRRR